MPRTATLHEKSFHTRRVCRFMLRPKVTKMPGSAIRSWNHFPPGKHLRGIGDQPGSKPGEFMAPHGIVTVGGPLAVLRPTR